MESHSVKRLIRSEIVVGNRHKNGNGKATFELS